MNKKTVGLVFFVLFFSMAFAQEAPTLEDHLRRISDLDQNLAVAKAENLSLMGTIDQMTLMMMAIVLVALFSLGIIFWKRNFIVGAFVCRMNNWRLAEVKYFRPTLRQYRTYYTRDPKHGKFGPKENWLKGVFDTIPDEIYEKKLSDKPFVSEENLNVYREFHEDDNSEVDPGSRSPLRLIDFRDQINARHSYYRLGVMRGRMGNEQKIQMAIIAGLMILGVGLLVTMNGVSEAKEQVQLVNAKVDSILPVMQDLNKSLYVASQSPNVPASGTGNIVGVVR